MSPFLNGVLYEMPWTPLVTCSQSLSSRHATKGHKEIHVFRDVLLTPHAPEARMELKSPVP